MASVAASKAVTPRQLQVLWQQPLRARTRRWLGEQGVFGSDALAKVLIRCEGEQKACDGQWTRLLSQSCQKDFQITQEHNKALESRSVCVYQTDRTVPSSISQILPVKRRFIQPFRLPLNSLVSEELWNEGNIEPHFHIPSHTQFFLLC